MSWVILACLISLTAELTLELNTAQVTALHYLDLSFLIFFATDLGLAWKFSQNSKEFFKQNWLNILALIPVIRALRFIRFSGVARLGRLAKLIKFRKIGKLTKNMSRGEKTFKRLRKAGKWVVAQRKVDNEGFKDPKIEPLMTHGSGEGRGSVKNQDLAQ